MALVSHARRRMKSALCYTPIRHAARVAPADKERDRMGLLRSVVDTVIGNMTPEERVEAIREVATQAIELMTPDERSDLANRILTDLMISISSDQRKAAAALFTDDARAAAQE